MNERPKRGPAGPSPGRGYQAQVRRKDSADMTGPARSLLSANCKFASFTADECNSNVIVFSSKCVMEANVLPYNKITQKLK